MRSYDVVVVGTGPGGQRAAIQAAKLGARVAAIEERERIGGAVINYGTIPSKALREAVLYLTGFRQRGLYGAGYQVKENVALADLTLRLSHVLERELAVMESQLARNGVELIRGHSTFVASHQLRVATQEGAVDVRGEIVILAPGSTPAHSPRVPLDGNFVVDADTLFGRQEIPQRGIVVGAGVIGVEYASIFALLAIEVTLLDARERFLEFLDDGIREALMQQMRANGVTFVLGEELDQVVVEDGVVTARTGSGKVLEADALLYTVGRQGNTEGLGLERVGLEVDERGRLSVDAQFRTSLGHIFAVGDVIGFPALAATSMEQGRLAARYALGAPEEVVPSPLPFGIYSIPEISMVGRTEQELAQEGLPHEVGLALYAETARGQILGDDRGLLKLLVSRETEEILGVHIIGEGATELVHIGQMLMGLGGRLDYLVDNVFNYPTLAECYKIAALDASNKLSGEVGPTPTVLR